MKFALAFLAVIAVSGNMLTVSSVPVNADKSVKEHLQDFIKLLPIEEIKDLIYEYAAEDSDFAHVVDYISGAEFKSELSAVEGSGEFKSFLGYLESIGIDAYEYVNKFNARVGVAPIVPMRRGPSSRITGTLPGLFKDLKALLPVDEIQKLYNEKLASAPEFAAFIQHLGSAECADLFGKLMSNPNLKGLIAKAESRGVKIEAIFDFIGSIFGFEFPPLPVVYVSSRGNSIVSHLQDFIKLLPLDKFKDLFYEYAAEDEDFAVVLDYMMGEEFKAVVVSIESTGEFKDQLVFYEKYGVPAYEYVNKVNAFLGIELIKPMHRLLASDITGGLSGFIKDVEALVPVEDVQKLFKEKVNKFPEFAALVKATESKEYIAMVDKLLTNKDIQELIGKAKAKGVDFVAILKFISSIFGFNYAHPY